MISEHSMDAHKCKSINTVQKTSCEISLQMIHSDDS